MKKILSVVVMCLCTWGVWAQKSVYIPNEWQNPWPSDSLLYAEEDGDGRYTWSRSRSRETDNIIVFWDKYYTQAPDKLSKNDFYYVDIDDLLQKCEAFFELECNKLGFVNPETSNVAKYKVMVLMNHTQTWTCYGGGYDYQVPALWLNPSTCKPVGHSVAHEVGHSFHYMCFAEHNGHRDSGTDNTGFHLACGNGQTIWEQTAQWQANQSYPELMFDQSMGVFPKSHNLAFSHEWHRYQSYWFHYYLCQQYNDITTVAQVWNQPMTGQAQGTGSDFNQALMKLKGLNTKELFRLYYDYAARCATWDFDVCIPYRDAHIGNFHYAAVQTGDHTYQVAMESAPQSTGFNVIPLKVPETGREIKATFTSLRPQSNTPLAKGDPGLYLNGETQWTPSGRTSYFSTGGTAYKGFRLGYVALMKDGTRKYVHQDSVYCQGSSKNEAEIVMTLPEGVDRLWMIVSPAPTKYYTHQWDDKPFAGDDCWPYEVTFEGTDLDENRATVYVVSELDGRPISDATFTYDVYLPKRNSYNPLAVTIKGAAAALLGTAFQMTANEVAGKMTAWKTTGPTEGQVMFYPVNYATMKTENRNSTANGYGHWFGRNGRVTSYDSGYLYSEFQPASLTFNIGQYPGKVQIGEAYTIGQALTYNDGSAKATAYFVFRIHITDGKADYELTEKTTRIEALSIPSMHEGHEGLYDLNGRQTTQASRGIYIQGGKKRLIR